LVAARGPVNYDKSEPREGVDTFLKGLAADTIEDEINPFAVFISITPR